MVSLYGDAMHIATIRLTLQRTVMRKVDVAAATAARGEPAIRY